MIRLHFNRLATDSPFQLEGRPFQQLAIAIEPLVGHHSDDCPQAVGDPIGEFDAATGRQRLAQFIEAAETDCDACRYDGPAPAAAAEAGDP